MNNEEKKFNLIKFEDGEVVLDVNYVHDDTNTLFERILLLDNEDIVAHCQKLYDQGLHAELQRYAQRKLATKFNNVELRRILAKSLMDTDNERLAIMHYEAILAISPRDPEVLNFLADYCDYLMTSIYKCFNYI